ncbi:MAG: DarT ssDNA thymidine ADP-ribosyltransferase family protein [Gammaproteobacteria bacterium]|nr:DarT ssDNA thymidine ADP-ribosyltransferase family protein [Gammaproteobacteria bacterium]
MAAHIGGNVARLWRHYAEQNERSIPQHRELPLSSHHEMHVGDCVPFSFCPRPVMRFVIHKKKRSRLALPRGTRSYCGYSD